MEYVKLNQIADILNGYNFKSSNYVEKGIRVIRITNVQQGYLEDKDPVYYPYLSEINKYMLKENDLLMSLTGNVGRVGLISNELLPAGLNQRVACIRCKNPDFSTKYLFYYFNNEIFRKNAINNSNGVAQLNLSTEWLKNVKIPIYSKDEQQKIIRQLDNIVVSIDNKKKEIEILDNLIKSQFIEMFGDEKNQMWPYIRLEEVGTCKNGMNFSYKSNGYKIRCLGVGDFKNNNIIFNTLELPNVELEQKPDKDYLLENEDIVFVRSNGNKLLVGRSVLVYPKDVPTVFSGFCIRFRKNVNYINSIYLLHALKTDDIRMKMHGRGANIQNLNQKILLNLLIPMPPKLLQEQFATIVEQIDKSKYILQKQIDALQELLDSKMEEFFG